MFKIFYFTLLLSGLALILRVFYFWFMAVKSVFMLNDLNNDLSKKYREKFIYGILLFLAVVFSEIILYFLIITFL